MFDLIRLLHCLATRYTPIRPYCLDSWIRLYSKRVVCVCPYNAGCNILSHRISLISEAGLFTPCPSIVHLASPQLSARAFITHNHILLLFQTSQATTSYSQGSTWALVHRDAACCTATSASSAWTSFKQLSTLITLITLHLFFLLY